MTDFAGLDGIPESWLSEAFVAGLHRRESLLKVTAGADAVLVKAQEDRDAAVVALGAGGDPADAVSGLLEACAAVLVAESARSLVPSAVLDRGVVGQVLQAAAADLDRAGRGLAVHPLNFDQQVARWRTACVLARGPLTPPVMTDVDREASSVVAEMVELCEEWQVGRRAWSSDVARGNVDPVGLLAAAVGRLGQAELLRGDVDRVNLVVGRVNRLRGRRGLNWAAPGGVRVLALQ